MNNALTIPEDFNLDNAIRDVESMQTMCKKLMQTKHYQAMGEAGIFAIIQKAKSLNMNPIDALGGSLYFVQGKVGMSTEAMNALIRRAGHSITKDPKSNNSICILHGRRADNGDTWTCSFSLEDAKRAGLMKNMFEKYPGVMLFNRCMSMLARQLFPDIIKGAGYTHDELKEIAMNTPNLKQETTYEFVEEKITIEQVLAIKEKLDKCPSEIIDKFYQFIKGAPISANRLEDISVSQFDNIYDLVCKRYEKAMADKIKDEKTECKADLHQKEEQMSFDPEDFLQQDGKL